MTCAQGSPSWPQSDSCAAAHPGSCHYCGLPFVPPTVSEWRRMCYHQSRLAAARGAAVADWPGRIHALFDCGRTDPDGARVVLGFYMSRETYNAIPNSSRILLEIGRHGGPVMPGPIYPSPAEYEAHGAIFPAPADFEWTQGVAAIHAQPQTGQDS